MRVAMIGTGYVGLVSGACFADFGHVVTCVDKDAAKIDQLNAGRMPIYEPGLEDLVAANVRDGRLSFALDGAEAIRAADFSLQLIVPPQGTRSETHQWKTGFYYIAQAAQVPIVMAYMDYPNKRSGLGPMFVPTGDVAVEMAAIQAFYAPFTGKNPPKPKAGD